MDELVKNGTSLTGIDIPESVEGNSLVPAIQDADYKVRETLYFAYGDLVRSTKDARYKLIEYRTDNLQETQLFDLINDPNELQNLFGKQGYETITENLRKELIRFKEEWEDDKHPIGQVFWRHY